MSQASWRPEKGVPGKYRTARKAGVHLEARKE